MKKLILSMFVIIVVAYSYSIAESGFVLFSEEHCSNIENMSYTLYGYKDSDGNVVIPAEYNQLYDFVDGSCVAVKPWYEDKPWLYPHQGYASLLDQNGKEIYSLGFIDHGMTQYYGSTKYLRVRVSGDPAFTYILIDRYGNEPTGIVYQRIEFYDRFIMLKTSDERVIVDLNLDLLVDISEYKVVYTWEKDEYGQYYTWVSDGNLYGVINEAGDYVTKPVYSMIDDWGSFFPYYSVRLPGDDYFTVRYANIYGELCELPDDWCW